MKILIALIFMFTARAFAKSSSSSAHVSKLVFVDAYIYAPLLGSPATAGYVSVQNNSNSAIKFEVKSASPFKAVETHETLEVGGLMKMQKRDSFVIPAHGRLEMKPGGNHIMLFEPSRDVKEGEMIDFVFLENGSEQTAHFKVVSRP